jgi:hypothetical protein
MPITRLLPDYAIGAFQSLGLVFADLVENFRGQQPFIATPIIAVPVLAIGFPLCTHAQVPNQFIGMFSDSRRSDQPTATG